MNFKIGWIKVAEWDRNVYRVEFRDQYDAYPVKLLSTGSQEPLDVGDQVLCFYDSQTNWIILGRIPTPEKFTQDDNSKSEQQRILEQQRKLIGQYVSGESDTGTNEDGIPNYRPKDEEALGFGDAQIRSRSSGAFVKADSSGNIIGYVSSILMFLFDTFKTGMLFRAKQLLLDIVPGFRLKIHSPPQQGSPQVPSEPEKSQKELLKVEAAIASDPDVDKVDYDMEVGALRDIDDPGLGTGRANTTTPYKIKTGARFHLSDWGIFEVDNVAKELRLSFGFGADQSALYQLRFNPKEATLSWGLQQFISLTEDGILIKAKSIGLAGPLVMWDPTKIANFKHNQDLPETDWGAVIEWDATKTSPGLRINKSIYFGDKAEPAVTKPYLDNVFSFFLDLNDKHFHTAAGFGAPTSPPVVPLKPTIDPFLQEPLVDTFLSIVKATV